MSESHRVLIVDDEATIRSSLRMVLEFEGYEVEEVGAGSTVLSRVNDRPPDAILLDIKMPDMDGLEVLKQLRERGFEVPVLVISGHGDVHTAVEATRLGAFDFLEKPLQRERVVVSLRNALESHRLARENRSLRTESPDLVGDSSPMKELKARIARAAPTPATVLILGESGTGKELVARAIHEGSSRQNRPLVQVNCAAIPEELIESELFGHEKGSFTGAIRKQTGKFLSAHGGTIFLDEIGDMSARTQAKVLRVLQSGEIEPVGAAATIRVDVRVVAATNRDLEKDIADGRFREDLFYRLNVLPIRTPPLRERLDDIPMLVAYFVDRFARESNYPRRVFEAETLARLKAMSWRGNVRELRNLVERLLILSPDESIGVDDLALIGTGSAGDSLGGLLQTQTLREFQEESEKVFIQHKLDQFGWNVTQTAQAIQTPRSNLYKKLEQYGLKRAIE